MKWPISEAYMHLAIRRSKKDLACKGVGTDQIDIVTYGSSAPADRLVCTLRGDKQKRIVVRHGADLEHESRIESIEGLADILRQAAEQKWERMLDEGDLQA